MPPYVRTAPFLLVLIVPFVTAVVCASASATRAQEEPLADFDRLARQFQEAFDAKEYAKALDAAEAMNAIVEPRHVETLYRLARVHARLGDRPQTYEWLQRTVDAGFWNAQQLHSDEDFKPFQGEPRFRAILRGAWANGYIAMLERDERAEFQKPEKVMEALALKPGERVADIGAGSGYFTIPVAKAVGPTGTVWAVDAAQEMIDYLDKRVQAEQLDNVKVAKVPRDDPQLPPGGVDTILMIDTIHYIQERTEYAKKLRAALAPGGRLVIIDYIPKPWPERPWGPPPEQQIPRETLDADLAKADFVPIKVHDFLPEQYFVVYGTR